MPRTDDRDPSPPLDHPALARLAAALDSPGVVAAYLIGSQARGTAGPLSDVDVAIWLHPDQTEDRRLDLALRLAAGARDALEREDVELIVLNDASPLLRHRALGPRHRLVERDPVARVRLEARAIVDYLDTAPLRDELAAGLGRRLEEGRFGRR